MNINKKLMDIRTEIKLPKADFNMDLGFRYRNAEAMLSLIKPVLQKHGLSLYFSDDICVAGVHNYVKSTLTVVDSEDGETVSVNAVAREDDLQTMPASPMVTGSASSYARKYALQGMFAIDDGALDPDMLATKPYDFQPEPVQDFSGNGSMNPYGISDMGIQQAMPEAQAPYIPQPHGMQVQMPVNGVGVMNNIPQRNMMPSGNINPVQNAMPSQKVMPVQNMAPEQKAAPVQNTIPVQKAAPVQNTIPVQKATPVQNTIPAQKVTPVQNMAPVQKVTPVQNTVPVQKAGGFINKNIADIPMPGINSKASAEVKVELKKAVPKKVQENTPVKVEVPVQAKKAEQNKNLYPNQMPKMVQLPDDTAQAGYFPGKPVVNQAPMMEDFFNNSDPVGGFPWETGNVAPHPVELKIPEPESKVGLDGNIKNTVKPAHPKQHVMILGTSFNHELGRLSILTNIGEIYYRAIDEGKPEGPWSSNKVDLNDVDLKALYDDASRNVRTPLKEYAGMSILPA